MLTRTSLLAQSPSDLEEGWESKLARLAVGAACLAGSGCAAQADRGGETRQRPAVRQDAGSSIRRGTEERLHQARAETSGQAHALQDITQQAPRIGRRLRRIKPIEMPGETATDRQRSVDQFHRQLLDPQQNEALRLTRSPLLDEALQVRRQSDKERMAKKRPAATFGAARSSKWLWQQERKKWSKEHPQYIFRKGKLIFVPPEKKRQLRSKIKGRVVQRAALPGSGSHG